MQVPGVGAAVAIAPAQLEAPVAVEMAAAGENAVMPTLVRVSDAPYEWTIGRAPLSEVANQEKLMPKSFFTEDGFGITDEARRYFAPLIIGEAYPPYRNGLPDYVTLENHLLAQKLPTDNRW